MSLAYPLPTPGQSGIGEPGPVTVPAGMLGRLLGSRELTVVRGRRALALVDTPIERTPLEHEPVEGAPAAASEGRR
jgi:3',5'-cyclic-AMP phosphodiesterase